MYLRSMRHFTWLAVNVVLTDNMKLGSGAERILNEEPGFFVGLVPGAYEFVLESATAASASGRYILTLPGEQRNRVLQVFR